MSEQPIGSDPETEEEYELLTGTSGDNVAPIDLINSYLPEREDWEAKTVIDHGDSERVAALRSLSGALPEVEHQQDVIDTFLDHYLKTVTSEGGLSRQEYLKLLNSLAGGSDDSDVTDSAGLLEKIMAPNGGEEDG